MKKFLAVFLLLAASVVSRAQTCDGVVIDEAKVLKNASAIEASASTLINQGADVHVVTVPNLASYGATLDDVEARYERNCASWRAPNGVRKANLVVLVLAPFQKKKNVFFGEAYKNTYPDAAAIGPVYAQAANPFFQTGDWDGGFKSALKRFGDGIAATNSQPKYHNAAIVTQTTVNKAATDLTPLATIFKILFGLGLLLLACFYGFRFIEKRNELRDATAAAQQDAISEFTRVGQLYQRADKAHPRYGDISEQYTTLAGSLSTDPREEGYTKAKYESIGALWADLRASLERMRYQATVAKSSVKADDDEPAAFVPKTSSEGYVHKKKAPVHAAAASRDLPNMPGQRSRNYSMPVESEERRVVDTVEHSSYIPPVVIIDREEPAYTPSYSSPEPSYASSSRDDDSSSGSSSGDSGWSSSSSDSGSSSSDSSSSSSCDSGGSSGGDSGF